MNSNIPNDEQIIERARGGDREAFDNLIERHLGLVHAIAFARLRCRESAEDLAQEVFLRAWLRLGELKEPRHFSQWISRTARNLATDWARRGQTASRLLPMVPLDDVAEHLPDDRQRGGRSAMAETEENELVHRAILGLPPKLAEVVLLHTAEALSHSQIAERLGIYPSTVMRRWRQALRRMRGVLEPMLGQSAPALKPSTRLMGKTATVIAAAGLMSTTARTALATAAGSGAVGGGAAVAAAIFKGGPMAVGAKLTGVAVTAVAIVAGGIALTSDDPPPPPQNQIVAVTAPQTTGVEQTTESTLSNNASPELSRLRKIEPVRTGTPYATLVGEYHVIGRVTDVDGNPLGDVIINTQAPTNDRSIRGQTGGRAGGDGTFDLTVHVLDFFDPVEAYDQSRIIITASAAGYFRETTERPAGDEDNPVTVDFQLRPLPPVHGRVVWAHGPPEVGAQVRIGGQYHQSEAAITDSDGQFTLMPVHEGTQSVELARQGRDFERVIAHTIDNENEELRIVLRAESGDITGQAVGLFTREPLPHIPIVMRPSEREQSYTSAHYGPEWDELTTTTDAEGRFQFEGIPIHGSGRTWQITSPGRLFLGTRHGHNTASVTAERIITDATVRFPEHVTASGEVTHADTGEPVPDVEFRLIKHLREFAAVVTTDSEGRFQTDELMLTKDPNTGGTQELEIELITPPWVWSTGGPITTVRFNDNPSGLRDLQGIELEVREGIPLNILALDPSGAPLENAEIESSRPYNYQGSFINSLGTTGGDGRLTVHRPPDIGAAILSGSHEDWPLLTGPNVNADTSEVTLQALPVAPLTVHVIDADEAPIFNANVSAYFRVNRLGGLYSSVTVGHNQSDRSGLVEFEILPRCELSISGVAGRARERLQINLAAKDASREVTLQLREPDEQSFTGHVVDVNRRPVAGAEIIYNERRWTEGTTDANGVVTRTERREVEDSTVSDPNGEFTITFRGRSMWRPNLAINAAGYISGRQHGSYRTGEEDLFILNPLIQLTGDLNVPVGQVPASTEFTLRVSYGQGHWTRVGLTNPQAISTEETGRFSIELPRLSSERHSTFRPMATYPGPAWILATLPDGRYATAGFEMTDQPGQHFDLGTLNFTEGQTLESRVVDPMGRPISGAEVRLDQWETESMDDGRFSLTGIPEGAWRFAITAEGHRFLRDEITLPGAVSSEMILWPQESFSLDVLVLGFDGQPMSGTQIQLSMGMSRIEQVTDAEGRAHFEGHSNGWARVDTRVLHEMGRTSLDQRIQFDSPETDHTVDFSNWDALTIRIINGDAPVADQLISVRSTDLNSPSGRLYCTGTTDSEGRITLRAPHVPMTIRAEHHTHEIEGARGREITFDLSEEP